MLFMIQIRNVLQNSIEKNMVKLRVRKIYHKYSLYTFLSRIYFTSLQTALRQ